MKAEVESEPGRIGRGKSASNPTSERTNSTFAWPFTVTRAIPIEKCERIRAYMKAEFRSAVSPLAATRPSARCADFVFAKAPAPAPAPSPDPPSQTECNIKQ